MASLNARSDGGHSNAAESSLRGRVNGHERRANPLWLDCPLRQGIAWAAELGARSGLSPMLDSGTLLGLQRDGALLPNDLDLDLTLCLSSESDLRCLQEALAGLRYNLWTFENRPFKVEIESGATDLPLAIDIKLFRMTRQGWVCPSVYPVWRGYMGSGGAHDGQSLRRRARAWARCRWRRAIARGDTANWPLRDIMHADAWVVPDMFLSEVESVPGYPDCVRPRQWQQYLTYRYGDWTRPVGDWVYWRDDGAYRRLGAEDDSGGHLDDLRRLWASS